MTNWFLRGLDKVRRNLTPRRHFILVLAILFTYIPQQFSILLIATLLTFFGMYQVFDGNSYGKQSQVLFDSKIIKSAICVKIIVNQSFLAFDY